MHVCALALFVCAQVMLVSFGKFNRERVKKLTGKDWIVMGEDEVPISRADLSKR